MPYGRGTKIRRENISLHFAAVSFHVSKPVISGLLTANPFLFYASVCWHSRFGHWRFGGRAGEPGKISQVHRSVGQ